MKTSVFALISLVSAAAVVAPSFAAPVPSGASSAASSTVTTAAGDIDNLINSIVSQGTISSSVAQELTQLVNLTASDIENIVG
ncbi:hypothetical protein CONPUDRAFT_144184, partial [Coniophora puteana RWD-64-598 SS2]